MIRADHEEGGLLFAGTESAMYVSFDDGDHWQSLMLNLPNTSYRDITIKDNDLVVGTYGRGIWDARRLFRAAADRRRRSRPSRRISSSRATRFACVAT